VDVTNISSIETIIQACGTLQDLDITFQLILQ